MSRPSGVEKEAVNVRLPEILVSRIRTTCKTLGVSFTDLIERAIRHELDGQPTAAPHTNVHNNGRKPRAKELVARFAGLGVTTAAQLEAQEPAANSPVVQVGNCPTEDVPRRDWVRFYREMGEMEPAEAEYAFSQATAEVRLPAGFRRQPPAKQVAWLQGNA